MHNLYFGNGLNCLVSVDTMLNDSKSTATIFTNGLPLGAHFSGMSINGSNFDNGMTYFEFPQGAKNIDSRYNGQIRYSWLPYTETIRKCIEGFVNISKVKALNSYINVNILKVFFIYYDLIYFMVIDFFRERVFVMFYICVVCF